MRFQSPLVGARLVRRYKRFLADVLLDSGEEITAHCANPGAMLGLTTPGARVWLSRSQKPGRKLPWSWELVEVDFGHGTECVGVNTAHPNAIVSEAVTVGFFPQFAAYPGHRREVKYGVNSRIDILLEGEGLVPWHVEIKNVHLCRKPGLAEFPDSVTVRGAKHLREMAEVVRSGGRAMMIYLIQMRAQAFRLASDIDPAYSTAFAAARAAGVEALAVSCDVSPQGVTPRALTPILD